MRLVFTQVAERIVGLDSAIVAMDAHVLFEAEIFLLASQSGLAGRGLKLPRPFLVGCERDLRLTQNPQHIPVSVVRHPYTTPGHARARKRHRASRAYDALTARI